jgi:UDP-4-amino-4,6-dideoxy-N-acetyl-beta-L-altrosamine transaminase
MISYSRQIINSEDIRKVKEVLKSDFLTQGPKSRLFEKKLSKNVGAKFATTFNSGTSALHISCLSLGVGKGDLVWTCTNSFVASANCALYCGANVDFVDIDKSSYNISISDLEKKLKISKTLSKLPKVIIPVHFGGFPCDMKSIFELSKKYKFKIIEDASHALGAKYYNNKIGDCKYSDITVFSFHPIKIITTAEGGAALTNSSYLDNKLKLLRTHGITRQKKYLVNKKKESWYYEFQELGYNYRLNEIQSALGLSQLERLNKWVGYRNQLADIYTKELKNLPLIVPKVKKGYYSSYHLFVIRVLNNKRKISRDFLYKLLKNNGIESNVHYIPIHSHPYYKKKGFKNKNFPNAIKYFKTCLSLPMHAGLTKKNQKTVINFLKKVYNNQIYLLKKNKENISN